MFTKLQLIAMDKIEIAENSTALVNMLQNIMPGYCIKKLERSARSIAKWTKVWNTAELWKRRLERRSFHV